MKFAWTLILMLTTCFNSDQANTTTTRAENTFPKTHLTTSNTIADIINHPAFKGFGELLLPWTNNAAYYNTSLNNVRELMPYHSHVDPEEVVSSLNHMIDDVNKGQKIFYDIYADEQKQKEPSLKQTGLFFFRGKPGAPFAIICPGGGFSYIGSLHEGFPLGKKISEQGLNAFVLRYRVENESRATDDLLAALSYVFANANALNVSGKYYSLWGGSAGARLVGNIAMQKSINYGSQRIDKPGVVVIAYTGQSLHSAEFPPSFIIVAANDGIANVDIVDRRVANLKASGVEVEYRRFQTAGHGFGTGKGTDAEGWVEDAIHFWKKHIK